MTRSQILRTLVLTAIIVVVAVSIDFIVNVVVAPGVTPYTPLVTVAIVLLVAPAAIAYLIMQNDKVQRATAALAEERVARLAADGANAAKTQFIANMSHELRTPLNAIIGYAEMIEEESQASPVCLEDAQRIQRSAHHLLGLITEILDHARLETGKIELRNAPTALDAVFNEVVETVRAGVAENGNVLETHCDAQMGTALVDPMRLRQCMLALAGNAAKFTKDGCVSLSLKAIGDDQFAFEVADTGIGMDEQTVANLFKPFVQADESKTRAYGGTGLGLTITKQLLDMMGGELAVRSEAGKGSVFTMTLKRSTAGVNVVTLAA